MFLRDNMNRMIIILTMMSVVPLCAMEKEQPMMRPTHVASPGSELVCYPNHVQRDEINLPEGATYRGCNIVQIPVGSNREYMKKIHPIIVDPERSTEFTVFRL
jgi:hypothetical protein